MGYRWIVCVCLLLGACQLRSPCRAPCPDLTPEWEDVEAKGVNQKRESICGWWDSFDDPLLSKFVDSLWCANLDIKQATERVRQVRALRRIAFAPLLPQINSRVGAVRERESLNSLSGEITDNAGRSLFEDNFLVGFDASWEIDIFGRQRMAVQAATSDIAALCADRDQLMVTLIAELVQNYVAARTFQRRIVVAQKNANSQAQVVQVTQARFDAGISSGLDIYQAQTLLSRTQAAIPSFESDRDQAIYRISVLLGQEPLAIMDEFSSSDWIPTPIQEIPLALPCDLIGRRPDIQKVSYDLTAAYSRYGVAVRDLFPKVTLFGDGSLQSVKLSNLLSWPSRAWQIGIDIVTPIFQGGRLRANVALEKARYQEIYWNYQQAILNALEEVRSALIRFQKGQERLKKLEEALVNSQESVIISRELYTNGLSDFLNVLESERAQAVVEDEVVEVYGTITIDAAALYKALGGGWRGCDLTRGSEQQCAKSE